MHRYANCIYIFWTSCVIVSQVTQFLIRTYTDDDFIHVNIPPWTFRQIYFFQNKLNPPNKYCYCINKTLTLPPRKNVPALSDLYTFLPIKINFVKFQTFFATATSIDRRNNNKYCIRRALTIQHYRLKNEHDRRVIVPLFSHSFIIDLSYIYWCDMWPMTRETSSNIESWRLYLYDYVLCTWFARRQRHLGFLFGSNEVISTDEIFPMTNIEPNRSSIGPR